MLTDLFPPIEEQTFGPLEPPGPRVVVRLRTSYWSNDRGVYVRRGLKYLKRKCREFNFIAEDAVMAGADELIKMIVNLDECKDGVYEVVACNQRFDYETGICDDWDYQLVPFKEETENE